MGEYDDPAASKVMWQALPCASRMEVEHPKMILNVPMDESKKKSSRDAARQRRGQQNDEYSEIALQLPLPPTVVEKLDRLCVMRLSSSYIKIKHILHEIEDGTMRISYKRDRQIDENAYNSFIQTALGGFVLVLAEDGQCLYVSTNVSEYLGLQQLDLMGHSVYKYVHPCDQESLAQQLGGHAPLADMEIFDGLFCSDAPHMEKPPKPAKKVFENTPHRSFFLRMKSTLTSRGKSVNINASIHRVVHCTGTMQMYRMKRGISNGSITRCFIGIGTPLLSNTIFEVPLDQCTFITKHALDMKLISIEDIGSNILGYPDNVLHNQSWYTYCHVCDVNVLKECHQTVLQKGQSVSSYYRVMVNNGGWVWLQTTANVVYSSSARLPTYIICTQYVISGVELEDKVLSLDQYPPTNKTANKKKQHLQNKVKAVEAEVQEVSPTVKPKAESSSPVYEYNFPKEEIKSEGNFHPLGNGSIESSANLVLLARCPWIPHPLNDVEIKQQLSSLDDLVPPTLNSPPIINDDLNRSPNIPEPTIDKILSFDDLSFPDFSESYQDLQFDDNDSTCSESEQSQSLLQDLTNARFPAHFLFKCDAFKEGSDTDVADSGKVVLNICMNGKVQVN